MIKAVLFDLDGTIVDSEPLSVAAWATIGDAMGFHLEHDFIMTFVGRSPEAIAQLLVERVGSIERAREAFALHQRTKMEIAERELTLKPHAKETLEALTSHGYSLGLATSSERSAAERELDRFGLLPYFTATTCGDEAPRSKPNPDIYLETARKLGVDPAECAVVEDSPNGVRAGHAADMAVFMIPDLIPATPEISGLCAATLDDLSQLLGAIERVNTQQGA